VIQVVMCDGSVQTLDRNMDYQVYGLLMTPHGMKAYDPGVKPPANGAVPQPAWQANLLKGSDW
jgi:hypothetical protein